MLGSKLPLHVNSPHLRKPKKARQKTASSIKFKKGDKIPFRKPAHSFSKISNVIGNLRYSWPLQALDGSQYCMQPG